MMLRGPHQIDNWNRLALESIYTSDHLRPGNHISARRRERKGQRVRCGSQCRPPPENVRRGGQHRSRRLPRRRRASPWRRDGWRSTPARRPRHGRRGGGRHGTGVGPRTCGSLGPRRPRRRGQQPREGRLRQHPTRVAPRFQEEPPVALRQRGDGPRASRVVQSGHEVEGQEAPLVGEGGVGHPLVDRGALQERRPEGGGEVVRQAAVVHLRGDAGGLRAEQFQRRVRVEA
mmetsp:Transcript_36051/g.70938  ORF Transcript_36051/g.70938 Transcript_36051/m.70938 type:complete len:231 (-) Transcript_36051:254-946(-)